MNLQRRFACVAVALMIAGCNGGGSTIGLMPSGAAPSLDSTPQTARSLARSASARARFTVRIPHRRLRAKYVSPNTRSMTISINRKKVGTYALTSSGRGCTTVDRSTQCSFTLGVPSGKVTFAVSMFASKNGTGTALSQGSVTKTIKAGTLAVIPLTLSGIVKAITVTLGDAHPAAGTAATIPVYVTAYDASGAAIIGPGNYGVPLALTDSDTSGITSLSSSTVKLPSASIALAYNGRSVLSATIGASASGVSSTSIAAATFAPTPRIFASYTLPAAVGSGSAAVAIASGPDGNVWYTTRACFCTPSGNNAIVDMTTSGTVVASYVAGTTPNLTGGGDFAGIVAGPDGKLWFTDNANDTIGSITTGGAVTEYSMPSGLCPNRIIAGASGDNGLWFTSTCGDAIGHITTTGTVLSQPLSGGGIIYYGLVLGKDGNIYVADQNNHAIGQVVLSGTTVTGYSEVDIGTNPADGSNNSNLFGIAQTADGTLWFTNQSCSPSTFGSIAIAATFSASTVNQYVTNPGCSYPAQIVAVPNSTTSFLAEWDYPVIAQITPNSGSAPTLTNFAIQAPTPNPVFQETYDMVVGPDGNLWSTIYTNTSAAPANVVEMAY